MNREFRECENLIPKMAATMDSTDYVPTKTVSCENISSLTEGKASFPHAFLRSKPPKSSSVVRRPPSVPTVMSEALPSFRDEGHPTVSPTISYPVEHTTESKGSLKYRLKAASEENFPLTWLRKNQPTMKLRLNPNCSRSKNSERNLSTQSVNCDTIIFHSPHAPSSSNYEHSYNPRFQNNNRETNPRYRASYYASNTESGYESDGIKHEASRNQSKKLECDADSGVSSETNSDSGSLTGNDSSFEQFAKTGSKSAKPDLQNKDSLKNPTESRKSSKEFCECSAEKDDCSKLNLTDEEKMVPPISETSAPTSSEPANITSLRQKFLVSQLSRQKSKSARSSPVVPSPSPSYSSSEESHYTWWAIPSERRPSFGRALPDSRQPLSLPPSLAPQVAPPRTYKMMRLTKDSSGELGIYITAKKDTQGSATGYVIAHIEKGGLTDR